MAATPGWFSQVPSGFCVERTYAAPFSSDAINCWRVSEDRPGAAAGFAGGCWACPIVARQSIAIRREHTVFIETSWRLLESGHDERHRGTRGQSKFGIYYKRAIAFDGVIARILDQRRRAVHHADQHAIDFGEEHLALALPVVEKRRARVDPRTGSQRLAGALIEQQIFDRDAAVVEHQLDGHGIAFGRPGIELKLRRPSARRVEANQEERRVEGDRVALHGDGAFVRLESAPRVGREL